MADRMKQANSETIVKYPWDIQSNVFIKVFELSSEISIVASNLIEMTINHTIIITIESSSRKSNCAFDCENLKLYRWFLASVDVRSMDLCEWFRSLLSSLVSKCDPKQSTANSESLYNLIESTHCYCMACDFHWTNRKLNNYVQPFKCLPFLWNCVRTEHQNCRFETLSLAFGWSRQTMTTAVWISSNVMCVLFVCLFMLMLTNNCVIVFLFFYFT